MQRALTLHEKFTLIVKSERKITFEVLLFIQTFDTTKAYTELGYCSLFDYLVRGQKYSESSAQRRISAARLLKQVPEISDDLKSGDLNLTQMSLAKTAINQQEKVEGKLPIEKKKEVLKKLKNKSTFKSKKILLDNFSEAQLSFSSPQPTREDDVTITLQFKKSDWEKMEKLKAHFSHTVPDLKLESLLLYWSEQLEKKKAKALAKEQKPTLQIQNPLPLRKSPREWSLRRQSRKPIAQSLKLQIRERAQHQCEYVSKITNQRCSSTHFLEDEHIIPVVKGGTNHPENLRLFCHEHNQLMAKKWGISREV
jgi:hypothetical protein